MRLFDIISTHFEKFDTTLRSYMVKVLGNDGYIYSKSNIFNILLAAIKGIMQNAMFYIEDALTEQNIETATRRTSVYSLATLSGYEPSHGSAAVGTIIIKNTLGATLPSGSTKIYIPDGTTIRNSKTSLDYIMVVPTEYYAIDLTKPLMSHQFKVIQGTRKTASFIGKGYPLEILSVSATNYDSEYIEVWVNGEQWEREYNLYDMKADTPQFVCRPGFDSTFEIIFGDGTYGKRITAGDTIIVKYITHDGEDGNILLTDTPELSITSTIYDASGNSVTPGDYLTITMDSQISGGTNPDSITFVRKMTGSSSRSLVLANEDNFRLFLGRFSFIGYSNIWVEPTSSILTISALTNYSLGFTSDLQYLSLSESDLLLSDNQKDMILTTIENSRRAIMGININFDDPIIRRYAAMCYVKVSSSVNKETAKESIKSKICRFFMDIPGGTTFIPKSDITHYILSELDYVTSFEISFISKTTEDAYRTGYYYKYERRMVNGVWTYIPVRYMYSSDTEVGLDTFGNISVDSSMEIPFLMGNFKYYPDKSSVWTAGVTEDITVDTIQVVFL